MFDETNAEGGKTFTLLAMQGRTGDPGIDIDVKKQKTIAEGDRFNSFYQLVAPPQQPKTEEEKRRAQLLKDLAQQFRKEDARYQGLRKDLKSLE